MCFWEHSLCSLFSSIAFSSSLCTACWCREGCFCGGLWFLQKRFKSLHSGVGFCSRNLSLGVIRSLLTSVCSVGCCTLQEVPLNDCSVFTVGNVLLDWSVLEPSAENPALRWTWNAQYRFYKRLWCPWLCHKHLWTLSCERSASHTACLVLSWSLPQLILASCK